MKFQNGSNELNRPTYNSEEYHFLFKIKFRNCSIGEIYMPDENICFPCPENKYSLNIYDKQCSICPDNAYCPGRNIIIVNTGYWRSNINSSKIYKCNEVSNPCLGGFNSTCKEGYSKKIFK